MPLLPYILLVPVLFLAIAFLLIAPLLNLYLQAFMANAPSPSPPSLA